MEIRKLYTIIEETYSDGGKECERPIKKVACAAVIKNPFAGRYEENLDLLVDYGGQCGALLSKKVADLLGGVEKMEAYGKAAIVGEKGEFEHGAACTHAKFGASVRETLKCGKAVLPSTETKGPLGTSITVPLHHREACLVRSHFNSMDVRVPDAPASDEIVVIFAGCDSGRPHPRIGGLRKEEIKGENGLN
ncbi:MAG TPA: amino acid synthesis family protein [Firmicutes bacterium]|nr:amino acid synthesis family protein [Bacillota bacterium]